MLTGIRNIIIINGLVGLYYLYITVTFMQQKLAWGPGIAPVIGIGFTLTAVVLLWRQRLAWQITRVLIYILALVIAVWAVLLLVDGALFKVPVNLLLYFLFAFYLIGVRGYLSTDQVRASYNAPAA